MSICSVDIDLAEHWECNVMLGGSEFFDLLIRSSLLSTKLIAGKPQDYQTRFVVLLIKRLKLGISLRG